MRRITLLTCLVAAFLAFPAGALALSGSTPTGQNGGWLVGGGQGGGGSIYWWNLKNVNANLNWPAPTSTPSATVPTRDSVGADCSNVWQRQTMNAWANEPEACLAPLSKDLGGHELWTNQQATGDYNSNAQEVHNPPNPFISAPVSISPNIAVTYNIKIWRQGMSKPIFQRRLGLTESLNPDPPDNGNLAGALQAWWRGGSTSGNLFYVGGSQAGPITNVDNAPASGPAQSCQSRWQQDTSGNASTNPNFQPAIGTQTGERIHYRPAYRTLWSSNGSPSQNGGACYWQGTGFDQSGAPTSWTDTAGHKVHESLYINWKLDLSSNGRFNLTYALAGYPDTWYAIQIVATDNRQQIMAGGTIQTTYCVGGGGCGHAGNTDAGASYDGNQYFRVYVPSRPLPPQKGCQTSCGGGGGTVSAKQPGVDISLNMTPSGTAVTRAPVSEQVNTQTVYDDQQDMEAAFVNTVSLNHFTPQLGYDGSRLGVQPGYWGLNADTGNQNPNGCALSPYDPNYQTCDGTVSQQAYGPNYITYSNDPGEYWRLAPAAAMGPALLTNSYNAPGGENLPPNTKPSENMFLFISRLNQAPGEAGDVPDGTQTQNNWSTTYERPTLSNPCPQGLPSGQNFDAANMSSGWPVNSNTCVTSKGTAPRNAWDDIYNASTNYEARWVGQPTSSTANIGVVDSDTANAGGGAGQHLRCTGSLMNPDASNPQGGQQIDNCQNTWVKLNILPSDTTQYAQGYLYVVGPQAQGWNGAADIWLNTVGAAPNTWGLSNRDSGETVGTFSSAGSSQRPEMFYCQQGAPGNAKLFGSAGFAKPTDKHPNAANTGDNLVDGSSDSARTCAGWAVSWQWAAWDPNSYNQANPGSNACQLTNVPPKGTEGQFAFTWPSQAEMDLYGGQGTYGAISNVPYVGKGPGKINHNNMGCYANLPGHYMNGTWNYGYTFHPAPDKSDYCAFKTQTDADNAPGGYVPLGGSYATRCASKAQWHDSSGWHDWWRYGWWVRTSVSIDWNQTQSNCYVNVNKMSQTHVFDPSNHQEKQRHLGNTPGNPAGLGTTKWIAHGDVSFSKTSPPPGESFSLMSCTAQVDGYMYAGSWQITQGEGRGWGANTPGRTSGSGNSGGRLPEGGYVASFTYNNLNTDYRYNNDYQLMAAYQGHKEWNWRTNPGVALSSSQPLAVFAARGTQ